MECVTKLPHAIMCIALLLSFIVVIPICIWSVYHIFKSIRTSDTFMMARKPKLSFNLLCLNLIDIAIIQPIYCLLFMIGAFDLQTDVQLYLIITTVLTDIRFIVFGFAFVARMWLLLFDHSYHRECVNMLWHRDNNENFYLKYRKTLGNPSYIIKFTTLFCLICLGTLSIPYFIANKIFYIEWLTLILFAIEALLLSIFYCRINAIDDKFGIKKEILFISICPGVAALIYYTIFTLISYFTNKNVFIINNCYAFYIYSFVMLFIMGTTVFIKTFIPTRFRTNEEHHHTIKLLEVSGSGHAICFEDVLGSRSALLLFVEHLESEFSVENILFLVEVAKFREYYLSLILEKQQYQLLLKSGIDLKQVKRLTFNRLPSPSPPLDTPSVVEDDKQTSFGLTREVSKSGSKRGKGKISISPKPKKNKTKYSFSLLIDFYTVKEYIANDFDLEVNIQHFVEPLTADFIPIPTEFENCTATQAAKNIFEQFVNDGSVHMINISWSCRSKIKQLIHKTFSDEDLSTIFLFDSAFNEIYSAILSDSFMRFKISQKFKDFLKNGHLRDVHRAHHPDDSNTENSFNQGYFDIHQSLQNYEKPKKKNVHQLELTPIHSGKPMDYVQSNTCTPRATYAT